MATFLHPIDLDLSGKSVELPVEGLSAIIEYSRSHWHLDGFKVEFLRHDAALGTKRKVRKDLDQTDELEALIIKRATAEVAKSKIQLEIECAWAAKCAEDRDTDFAEAA